MTRVGTTGPIRVRSSAGSEVYKGQRLTKAKKPPRTYITGIAKATGKRSLVVEVSASMSEQHEAVAMNILRALETGSVWSKEQALALRLDLLSGRVPVL